MIRSTATQTQAPTKLPQRRRRITLIPPAFILGLWRMKRMWRLLLVAQLGALAAVTLVCAVPLFSLVTESAGIEVALAGNPYQNLRDDVLYANVSTNTPSQHIIQQIQQRITSITESQLAAYHVSSTPTDFSMTSNQVTFTAPAATASGTQARVPTGVAASYAPNQSATTPMSLATTHWAMRAGSGGVSNNGVTLFAYGADTISQQVRVIRGRLPQQPSSTSGLEIAVTQTTANDLHLTLGSTLSLPTTNGSSFPLRVVGVIASASATNSFSDYEPQTFGGPNGPQTTYFAVVSSEAVKASHFDWTTLTPSYAYTGENGKGPGAWNLSWDYSIDLAHLSQNDIHTLLDGNPQRYNAILYQEMSAIPGTQGGFMSTSLFDRLASYKHRIVGAEIAVFVLLADILGLTLLFLSLIINMLIERQEPLIALLRSRGASRRQLFGAFATQNVGLALLALLAGPLLAILLTRSVVGVLLPPQDQNALSVLGGNPITVAESVGIFALVTTLIALASMLWATRRATRHTVVSLRQETTRAARKPLWQRLYLDVLFALLALGGYTCFTLLTRLAGTQPTRPDLNIGLILSPLALIAPIFLMLGASLLFLRLFPILLRLGEHLAARSRGAPALLALTQLSRASRQATRIALLLALTTAFALFAITANATITRQIADAAAFQTGADFSGALVKTATAGTSGLSAREQAYEQLKGVTAAALAYRTSSGLLRVNGETGGYIATTPSGPTAINVPGQDAEIIAVNPTSFARTVIWPTASSSSPSIASLMSLLSRRRGDATQSDSVYAIVDADMANILHVRPGASFSLPVNGYTTGDMRFVTAAIVPNIPTVYARDGGGILVDYASYATVYAHDTGDTSGQRLSANFAWLRVHHDAPSLASVRAAIGGSGPLQLSGLTPQEPSYSGITIPFTDRLVLITSLQNDPLHFDLVGMIDIGATAALLLALFATFIATWLHAREQGAAFALLRALGMAPRRLIAVIAWEQGIVYAVALALGCILGAALSVAMLPALPNLIFSSAFAGPITDGGSPVTLVWPWPMLVAALALLALICGSALALASRMAARPSLAQTLRLNE